MIQEIRNVYRAVWGDPGESPPMVRRLRWAMCCTAFEEAAARSKTVSPVTEAAHRATLMVRAATRRPKKQKVTRPSKHGSQPPPSEPSKGPGEPGNPPG